MHRVFARLALAAPAVLIVAAAISAVATANTVPASSVADQVAQSPITADDLKPTYCTMTITNSTVVLDGNGTSSSDLLLGTSGNDTGGSALKGAQGDDCIVGGAGNDTLNGGPGTDVCDGGPGTDSFVGCETTLNDP